VTVVCQCTRVARDRVLSTTPAAIGHRTYSTQPSLDSFLTATKGLSRLGFEVRRSWISVGESRLILLGRVSPPWYGSCHYYER